MSSMAPIVLLRRSKWLRKGSVLELGYLPPLAPTGFVDPLAERETLLQESLGLLAEPNATPGRFRDSGHSSSRLRFSRVFFQKILENFLATMFTGRASCVPLQRALFLKSFGCRNPPFLLIQTAPAQKFWKISSRTMFRVRSGLEFWGFGVLGFCRVVVFLLRVLGYPRGLCFEMDSIVDLLVDIRRELAKKPTTDMLLWMLATIVCVVAAIIVAAVTVQIVISR